MIQELSGTHLNSRVVDIFLKTVAPYPIGTMVKVLSGTYQGCQGVVADVDESVLDRPKVRVLFDPDGTRIEAVDIELKEEDGVTVESVRGEVPTIEPLGSSKSVADAPGSQPHGSTVEDSEAAEPDKKKCGSCGHLSKGKFCPECGAALGE